MKLVHILSLILLGYCATPQPPKPPETAPNPLTAEEREEAAKELLRRAGTSDFECEKATNYETIIRYLPETKSVKFAKNAYKELKRKLAAQMNWSNRYLQSANERKLNDHLFTLEHGVEHCDVGNDIDQMIQEKRDQILAIREKRFGY